MKQINKSYLTSIYLEVQYLISNWDERKKEEIKKYCIIRIFIPHYPLFTLLATKCLYVDVNLLMSCSVRGAGRA